MDKLLQWQWRVVEEKNQLDERRLKLDLFFESLAYRELSPGDCRQLRDQASHMKDYSEVLGDRIAGFES